MGPHNHLSQVMWRHMFQQVLELHPNRNRPIVSMPEWQSHDLLSIDILCYIYTNSDVKVCLCYVIHIYIYLQCNITGLYDLGILLNPSFQLWFNSKYLAHKIHQCGTWGKYLYIRHVWECKNTHLMPHQSLPLKVIRCDRNVE